MLQHIARGYMYKEIAHRLGISAKTVEAHVSAVLRKLQLSSRHELTRWAPSAGCSTRAADPGERASRRDDGGTLVPPSAGERPAASVDGARLRAGGALRVV